MDSDLLRQRRNLILVSIVLAVFDIAKVEIGRVNVLGTNLLIGNPEVVHWLMWLAWAYFFVRYLQYLSVQDDLGLLSGFSGRLSLRQRNYLNRRASELWPDRVQYYYLGPEYIERKGLLLWEQKLFDFDPDQGTMAQVGSEAFEIPRLLQLYYYIASVAYVVFVSPRATDHVLPVLLAMLAPSVTLCS